MSATKHNKEVPEKKEEPKGHCICNSELNDDQEEEDTVWIFCEEKDCPIEWFHLVCVGLTKDTIPDGKWYCDSCCNKRDRKAAKKARKKLQTDTNINVVGDGSKSNSGGGNDGGGGNRDGSKKKRDEMPRRSSKDGSLFDFDAQSTSSSQPTSVYICEVCDEQFTQKDKLLRHKSMVHNFRMSDSYSQVSGMLPLSVGSSQRNPVDLWEVKSATSDERANYPMSPQIIDDDIDGQSSVSMDTGKKTQQLPRSSSQDCGDESKQEEGSQAAADLSDDKFAALSLFSEEDILKELMSRQDAFVCECGLVFEDQALYFMHKQCHNTNDPKKCSFCSYEAKDWYDFTSHFLVHKSK